MSDVMHGPAVMVGGKKRRAYLIAFIDDATRVIPTPPSPCPRTHARAYHAQAKGKIERWFRTARMQLLPLLKPADLASLDALNRRLWAWVEGEYHRAPHRGLGGATPLDRWASLADEVRYLGPDIDDLFLHEAKRKVAKDRTVSLNGDAALVDEAVVLRYDPARPGRRVQVWLKGARVQDAKAVDVHGNCFAKREPEGLRLADLGMKED
jgi:hypothetical protein